MRGLSYNSVHEKVILLCSSNVAYVISPQDGSHSVLQELPAVDTFLNISCIDPLSGDVIVEIRDGNELITTQLKRISMTTKEMTTIDLDHLGWDHWHMHPCRLIFLKNGERVVLGLDEVESNAFYIAGLWGAPGVAHYDDQWNLLSWTEAPWAPFDYPPPPTKRSRARVTAPLWHGQTTTNGIYGKYGNALAAYNFEKRAVEVLAGNIAGFGCADGVGCRAQFDDPGKIFVNSKFLYTRCNSEPRWLLRMVQLDLSTLRVDTMHVFGLEHFSVEAMCVSEEAMYAFVALSASTCQLYRASLHQQHPSPGLQEATTSLDFESAVRPVIFHLAGGIALEIDGRLLIARSEYFRKMLTSEWREGQTNEVDLTNKPDADQKVMNVMLRFITCDDWVGTRDDMELALRVRHLADLYQLPKLMVLADDILLPMLNPNRLLLLLERVHGSGGRLEQACWQMLHAQPPHFMSEHKETLDEIIERNAQFAEDLQYYTKPMTEAAAEPYDDKQTQERVHEDLIEQFSENSDPIEVITSSASESEL